MVFSFGPFGLIARAAHHDGLEALLAAVDTFPARRIVCHAVSVI